MKNRVVSLNPERAAKVREALQFAGVFLRGLDSSGGFPDDDERDVLSRAVGRACLAFDAARDETWSEAADARTLLEGMRRALAVLRDTDPVEAVEQAESILADYVGGAEQVDGVR